MKHSGRIILYSITSIIFLTLATPGYASGFIFNWKPFVVEKNLAADLVEEKTSFFDMSRPDAKPSFDDMYFDRHVLSAGRQDDASELKTDDASFWKFIKINFSASKHLTANAPEKNPVTEEKQISDFLNAVNSIIYDDAKIKSLENIGTLFEPQINFYFEF